MWMINGEIRIRVAWWESLISLESNQTHSFTPVLHSYLTMIDPYIVCSVLNLLYEMNNETHK